MATIKVRRYFYGLTIEANNFAFEIKVILGLESTHPGCQVAKIELRSDYISRVLPLRLTILLLRSRSY